MLLCSCPRCHDSIRIPTAAQAQSMLRCPRCREQFPLHEVLDTLPPEAEVVFGPGAVGHTVVPSGMSEAEDYGLIGDEPSKGVPEFRFKETGPLRPDTPMAKIDSSRPSRRPKKAEPNIALEFVKIVVGGFAGLALAVLLIMWFMHRDPFGIAEKLPAQAYFVVPAEMRSKAMKDYVNAAKEPTGEVVEEDLTIETIPAEETPVVAAPTEQSNSEEPEMESFPPVTPPGEELPLEDLQVPSVPPLEPAMREPMLEDPFGSKPTPKPADKDQAADDLESGEVFPGTLTFPEEVAKATEATQLLGAIGAQIPPLPGYEPTPPTNVGNVDLSPVGDGEN